MGYCELQVTSNFSFLRGASHPEELVEQAAAFGYPKIAITDVNTMAGIVRDEALYAVVEKRIRDCCAELGLQVLAWMESPIQGGDGNREFFVDARRTA